MSGDGASSVTSMRSAVGRPEAITVDLLEEVLRRGA
jgi:hypothetical protein